MKRSIKNSTLALALAVVMAAPAMAAETSTGSVAQQPAQVAVPVQTGSTSVQPVKADAGTQAQATVKGDMAKDGMKGEKHGRRHGEKKQDELKTDSVKTDVKAGSAD